MSAVDSSKLKLEYDYGTTANNGSPRSQTITLPGVTHPLVQSYVYDELNRLRSAEETRNGVRQWIQSFAYDRYGNRTLDRGIENNRPKTSPELVTIDPQGSDSTNRIIARAEQAEQYRYDAAGNLTRDAFGNTFTHDGENRQVKYFDAGDLKAPAATYLYDGNGRRVKKQHGGATTIYVYNARASWSPSTATPCRTAAARATKSNSS